MEPIKPYEVGEVITLGRFHYLPKHTRGAGKIRLKRSIRTVVVRVSGHWRGPSGMNNYTAVPVEPFGKTAIWLKGVSNKLEQRIFFFDWDVYVPEEMVRGISADDYSPVL